MRVWKLVSGILSIILFAVVMFQSCAAGVVNALEDNGGISGSVGVIVGILILFGLAAVFGFAGYGNYSDLVIWSVWCLINAVLAVVSMIKNR